MYSGEELDGANNMANSRPLVGDAVSAAGEISPLAGEGVRDII